jgi:hypothetical protein
VPGVRAVHGNGVLHMTIETLLIAIVIVPLILFIAGRL